MLYVIQANSGTDIILTLDGRDYEPILYLKHDATRKYYTVGLTEDISNFKDRYNLFAVSNTPFRDMPQGYYNYWIKEQGTGLIIEQGKLLIQPDIQTPIPIPDVTEPEIIVIK